MGPRGPEIFKNIISTVSQLPKLTLRQKLKKIKPILEQIWAKIDPGGRTISFLKSPALSQLIYLNSEKTKSQSQEKRVTDGQRTH